MNICELFDSIEIDIENKDIDILGITSNSKEVKPGYVFFAFKGFTHDGYDFIEEAIRNGAKVIVTYKDFNFIFRGQKVLVEDPEKLSNELASKFYKYPSKDIRLIGVTGTNGKTTITYLLDYIYKAYNKTTGVIGTISYKIKDRFIDSVNTTPNAITLQKILREMVDNSLDVAIMEVSSHALALDRVKGCEFDIGVFTNITQDHLDFHKTMEDYLLAKKRLFDNLNNKAIAVINSDDENYKKLIKDIKVPALMYSLKNNSEVFITNVNHKMNKISFDLNFGSDKKVKIETSLIGKHNLSNILAAATVAYHENVPLYAIKKGIENARIPGRFEVVDCGQDFTCLVDYAHTNDALNRLIDAARELKPNRIITVFGCGGDRDREKRPFMGYVASSMSDEVIVTLDNPRTEDPKRIMIDIEIGLKRSNKNNYKIISDRFEAISSALNMAKKNDVVLLAGKGHEIYQIIGQKKIHFDDRETAKNILKEIVEKKKDLTLFDFE